MTIRTCSFILALFCIAGCAKSPVDSSEPIPVRIDGDYYAHASLGGDAVNILFHMTEDTTGDLYATIRYDGVTTIVSLVTTDSLRDSLFITYVRGGTTYTARSAISTLGLAMRFTSHSSIPIVYLYRDLDGYNMTGFWNGHLQSNLFSTTVDATMDMTQSSVLFNGDVTVQFFETLQAMLNSGAVNQNFFQLSGQANYGGTPYDLQMIGSFVTVDSITGDWYLGDGGGTDNGVFQFKRTF